jgi:hypothetical protein
MLYCHFQSTPALGNFQDSIKEFVSPLYAAIVPVKAAAVVFAYSPFNVTLPFVSRKYALNVLSICVTTLALQVLLFVY